MSKDSERCERFSKVRVRLSFLCTNSLHEIKGSILIIMSCVSSVAVLCRPFRQELCGSIAHNHPSFRLHGEALNEAVSAAN